MSSSRIPLPMFRTVLFAADFSDPSRQAFAAACSLAREEATRLVVLHVEEPLGFLEMAGPVYIPGEDAGDPALLARMLRDQYVPNGPFPVDYRVVRGQPAAEILRAAGEEHCDLVVMGTQGRTGLDRLLLGSVAEAVLRRAGCPVLTLRSPSSGAAGPRGGAMPIRTILHPTDFSTDSGQALRIARAIARDQGARLVLLHVIVPPPGPAGVSEVWDDLEIGREALAGARATVDGPDLKHPVETELRRGHADREILETASQLGCDLIVMGSHGRGGLGRVLMGSVAEAVLRGAGCPVLTVKQPRPTAASHPQPGALAEA